MCTNSRTLINVTPVIEGETSFFHRRHNFRKVLPWDKKFGSEVLVHDQRYSGNIDDPTRNPDDPPLATYKWHLGCKCGATVIEEVRALL